MVDEVDLYIHVDYVNYFGSRDFPGYFLASPRALSPAIRQLEFSWPRAFALEIPGGVRIHNDMALYCM